MNIFFARLFRTLGRFLMAVGAILCLGFGAIYLIPEQAFNSTDSTAKEDTPAVVEQPAENALLGERSISTNITVSVLAVIVVGFILFGIYKAARYYNDVMRRGIAKLAKLCKTQIYNAELILTLMFWILAVAFTFAFSPYIAVVSLLAMIANLLCFTLAWISYGQPRYVI